MKTSWQSIASAPKDGRPIKIRGLRHHTLKPYKAAAVWTTRKCPVTKVTGWFPPSDRHDGGGPFIDVTHWKPMGDDT